MSIHFNVCAPIMFVSLLYSVLVSSVPFYENNTLIIRSQRSADYTLVNLENRLQHISVEPVIVECTKNHKKSSAKLHQQSLSYFCNNPRKRLITVKMPTQEIAYFPMAIEIDRCEGLCHLPNSECMAIEKQPITIPVQEVKVTPILMSSTVNVVPKCLEYQIDKHLKCKCVCKISANDCNEMQDFSESSCRCLCKNSTIASECEKQSKEWSPTLCRCQCPRSLSTLCSSGFEFNEDSCSCERKQSTN